MNSDCYDAIVVGSGFGGSTAAYALARTGLRTLLLERGGWVKRDDLDWNQREILLKLRYKNKSPLLVKQNGDKKYRPLYYNEAVGGMSVFYGGASLRLRERDFAGWPLEYGDLEQYYGQVERLLGVHGEAGQDACEPYRSQGYPFPPIEFTAPARRLYEAARRLDYSPFKLPLAINFTDRARTRCIKCITCDGFPCKIEAKNDLTTTVLRAAQRFGLVLMPGIVVRRLVEKQGRIAALECVDKVSQKSFALRAKVVVLSAGALHSAAMLLRSRLERCEQQRLIGRFLMRHCNGVTVGLFPFRTNPEQIFHKQLCFTDFYEDMRAELGTAVGVIQDIYTPAPAVLRHKAPWRFKALVGLAGHYVQNLLCVAEDEAQYHNAVHLSAAKDPYDMELVEVEHQYSAKDYRRRAHLLDRAREVLKEAGAFHFRVYDLPSFSHAVGTLRFGDSPRESVLDRDCCFWGIENLFALDGSFMPSSGGVNPSLTIAANALRVAERIGAEFSS